MKEPNDINRHYTRFTGVIDTLDREESLIILPNIGFTARMTINARTRDILKRTKYKHHILQRTWNA